MYFDARLVGLNSHLCPQASIAHWIAAQIARYGRSLKILMICRQLCHELVLNPVQSKDQLTSLLNFSACCAC